MHVSFFKCFEPDILSSAWESLVPTSVLSSVSILSATSKSNQTQRHRTSPYPPFPWWMTSVTSLSLWLCDTFGCLSDLSLVMKIIIFQYVLIRLRMISLEVFLRDHFLETVYRNLFNWEAQDYSVLCQYQQTCLKMLGTCTLLKSTYRCQLI